VRRALTHALTGWMSAIAHQVTPLAEVVAYAIADDVTGTAAKTTDLTKASTKTRPHRRHWVALAAISAAKVQLTTTTTGGDCQLRSSSHRALVQGTSGAGRGQDGGMTRTYWLDLFTVCTGAGDSLTANRGLRANPCNLSQPDCPSPTRPASCVSLLGYLAAGSRDAGVRRTERASSPFLPCLDVVR
jgi:hypothetical protein